MVVVILICRNYVYKKNYYNSTFNYKCSLGVAIRYADEERSWATFAWHFLQVSVPGGSLRTQKGEVIQPSQ